LKGEVLFKKAQEKYLIYEDKAVNVVLGNNK
jgi:hypothetical protein